MDTVEPEAGTVPARSPMHARKSRRPAFSCYECRRRKVKCDRNDPCLRCRHSKVRCVFTADGVAAAQVLSPSVPTTAVATTAGYTPVSLDTVSRGSTPLNVAHQTSVSQRVNPVFPSHERSELPPRTSYAPLPMYRPTNEASESRRTKQHQDEILQTARIHGTYSKSRIHGSSHWINSLVEFDTVRTVAVATDFNDSSTWSASGAEGELPSLLYKCKTLARAIKAQAAAEPVLSLRQAAASIPSKEIADSCVRNYLRCSEFVFRVLHIPSFLKEYHNYWDNSKAPNDWFLATLLLVLSIGAHFVQDPPTDNSLQSLTLQCISASRTFILLSPGNNKLSLSSLQAQCLLLLADLVHPLGAKLPWNDAGTLLRSAMQLGLHRDPTLLPKISPLQIELRRRLWYTILELNLQTSTDAGMMPMLSYDDFDTLPPLNIDDEDMTADTKALPIAWEISHWTQTSMQIILQESLKTRYKVARLINNTLLEPSFEEVLQSNTKMMNAHRKAIDRLAVYTHVSDTTPTIAFLKNMLNLMVRRFIHTLHRSFAVKARRDPRYFFSRKACIDNAYATLYLEPDDDSSRLQIVGDGMHREMLAHNAFTFCSEVIAQLGEDAHDSAALERNKPIRDSMTRAIQKILEIHQQRLAFGETNAKLSVVASMALAQIEALESNTDPKPRMLEAARISLLRCLNILQNRKQAELVRDSSCSEQARITLQDDFDATQLLLECDNGFDFADPTTWLFPDCMNS